MRPPDPYGIDILRVQDTIWIGLKLQDLIKKTDSIHEVGDRLISMSNRSRSKAVEILKMDRVPKDWRSELELQLLLGKTAEIQHLDLISAPEPAWLDTCHHDGSSPSRKGLVEFLMEKMIALTT
ncbi:hypothetical protein IE53DRAFT_370382 [Violaceomyces palustris]|uniref:Uncharacterized protein n=1 Tax=Violaceomyces palustris TaxID=1673888 RepID=A0ACD0NSC3_9BASI|nr:hypothetical protein IE53DRAFT_370382 [Violaceomyces palustris]